MPSQECLPGPRLSWDRLWVLLAPGFPLFGPQHWTIMASVTPQLRAKLGTIVLEEIMGGRKGG